MRIRNRYLPQWLHRIANVVVAALCLAYFAATVSPFLDPGSLPWKAAILLLRLSVPVGLSVAMIDPRRFSLVEGVAGEDGYDELS